MRCSWLEKSGEIVVGGWKRDAFKTDDNCYVAASGKSERFLCSSRSRNVSYDHFEQEHLKIEVRDCFSFQLAKFSKPPYKTLDMQNQWSVQFQYQYGFRTFHKVYDTSQGHFGDTCPLSLHSQPVTLVCSVRHMWRFLENSIQHNFFLASALHHAEIKPTPFVCMVLARPVKLKQQVFRLRRAPHDCEAIRVPVSR